MSENAERNTPTVPTTRAPAKRGQAAKRAARRARRAAWRQTPAGQRRAANMFDAHAMRLESINANMPPALADVMLSR